MYKALWSPEALTRIDFRIIPVIIGLMCVSLLVISSYTMERVTELPDDIFFTQIIKTQLRWFVIGWCVFVFFAGFDYNKLREWTWFLYIFVIFALGGLFFTSSIAGVHRWYKIPLLNFNVQPSEYAKLIVVIALSWFLERRRNRTEELSTVFFASL